MNMGPVHGSVPVHPPAYIRTKFTCLVTEAHMHYEVGCPRLFSTMQCTRT